MNEVGTDEGDLDLAENFSDLFLRNVSLFYMRLQGHFCFLLPALTIQNIVEEMQNIHELGQTYTLSKLSSLLKNDTPMSDEDIVCESVRGFDLFAACHTESMRTAYSRTQSFKKMFNFVEPKKLFSERDENQRERFAYYVPVRETVLSKISDGQIFEHKDFLCKTHPV